MNVPRSSLRNAFLPFFPSRAAETLPVRLRGRRIYILPTRGGLIFFAMLFTLLFGSINHNNNLGFILTFLLGGMSFISIFHTYRNIAGITLLSSRAEPVFAGQQAVFAITLEARGASRQGLSLSFSSGRQTTLDLRPKISRTVKVYHQTKSRGLLRPGPLSITTTYPLALFRGRTTIVPDTTCLVYPKPLSGPIISTRGRDSNDKEGDSGGPGVDDFAGLAGYQRGDPLRHISWKTYSRGQGLYTKKFEGQQGKAVYFDPDSLPGSDLEKKLSRICYMILKAEAIRVPYGLRLGTNVIPPDLGGPHKKKCLRELALTGWQA